MPATSPPPPSPIPSPVPAAVPNVKAPSYPNASAFLEPASSDQASRSQPQSVLHLSTSGIKGGAGVPPRRHAPRGSTAQYGTALSESEDSVLDNEYDDAAGSRMYGEGHGDESVSSSRSSGVSLASLIEQVDLTQPH